MLLENLNSETSEKLPSLEQKSRLLKDSITKRYEPVVGEYLDSCIDKLLTFYLDNLDDIHEVLQQATIQKQKDVDTFLSELQHKKQHIQRTEEQKRQEINKHYAETLELLQKQRDSLQENLELIQSELKVMEMELSNIAVSLKDEQQNDECETLIKYRNSLQDEIEAKQGELQDLKEQICLRETQLNEYSSALDRQQCGPNLEAERELVAKTNVRLREQIEKMQNVLSKRFPSEERELRSLALAELQNEMALSSLQHSILESAANQQFSECKKLLHALGTLIRNCSSNTRTATAMIKMLDIFFQNNEIVEKQNFAFEQLKGDLDAEEAKEALSEMIRLGLLHEHEAGCFVLAASYFTKIEPHNQTCSK